MNPLTSNIQKMAFLRQPTPFALVEIMDFVIKETLSLNVKIQFLLCRCLL